MFKRVIFSLSGVTIATGLYLQHQKVPLKNQTFRSVLDLLHTQSPRYSSWVLRMMIRFQMIKECQEMKKYVLAEGFDFDAKYIDGLMEMGFDTVEFGPVALIPSCIEEERMHFGNSTAIGNISVFYEQMIEKEQKREQSKIGVSITPNFQILKYTPYLIQQNMLNCLKQLQVLNEGSESLKIHRYILNLNDPILREMHSQQYLTLVKSLIFNAHRVVDATLQVTKKQFPAALKPDVIVQIPNKSENPKLYEVVTAFPQLKHLIIDGNEFNLQRVTQKINKKIVENIQLSLGKNRLTFTALLDKLIHGSL